MFELGMEEDSSLCGMARLIGPTLLCSSLLVLCGCVYISPHTIRGACPSDLGSPIRNFCVVAPGTLWRGPHITASDATWLLEHGVGSIVSLQLNDQRAFELAAPDSGSSRSIPYFQLPGFSPMQVLSRDRLDSHVALFLAIVKQAPKPVYVHCRAGVDRTGVVTAAYEVLVEGTDREQVIAEMARWHSPWFGIDARYIRQLSPERGAEIMRQAEDWQARLRPSAQIDCLRGKCTFARNDVDPTNRTSVRSGKPSD